MYIYLKEPLVFSIDFNATCNSKTVFLFALFHSNKLYIIRILISILLQPIIENGN